MEGLKFELCLKKIVAQNIACIVCGKFSFSSKRAFKCDILKLHFLILCIET